MGYSREVTAWAVEARDKSRFYRIDTDTKDDRYRLRRRFGSKNGRCIHRRYDPHLTTNQVKRERWQSFIMTFRPLVFDSHIATIVIAGLAETLDECCTKGWIGRRVVENPITGIAGCCARTASGHATVALPTSVMNSRRLMGFVRAEDCIKNITFRSPLGGPRSDVRFSNRASRYCRYCRIFANSSRGL